MDNKCIVPCKRECLNYIIHYFVVSIALMLKAADIYSEVAKPIFIICSTDDMKEIDELTTCEEC